MPQQQQKRHRKQHPPPRTDIMGEREWRRGRRTGEFSASLALQCVAWRATACVTLEVGPPRPHWCRRLMCVAIVARHRLRGTCSRRSVLFRHWRGCPSSCRSAIRCRLSPTPAGLISFALILLLAINCPKLLPDECFTHERHGNIGKEGDTKLMVGTS